MRIYNKTKKIPDVYLSEYKAQQASLIKSRVGLFCVLTVSIYFLSTFIGYLLYPSGLKVEEIPLWAAIIIGGAVIFYLSRRAKSIRAAKLNAYLFTALFLVVLTKASIIYYRFASVSPAAYLFLLFLVSFTIPWKPAEIFPITFMHLSAFSFLFLHFNTYLAEYLGHWYVDGVIFLFIGFILCVVIRRKEQARDIENFLLLKEVGKKGEQMQRELELATRIHKTLLPKSIDTDLVDIAVTYLPMDYMGGDYAKLHFIDRNRLIFIICDVTGHGVSAALTVNRLHTEFDRLAREGKEPGLLLNELNEFITKDFQGVNMYLSAFCGMLNFKTKEFIYSNHGHPSQYIYNAANTDIKHLDSQTSLIGITEKSDKIYQQKLSFGKGDRILLFTDGAVETKDIEGREFGNKALEDLMRANPGLGAEDFNKGLLGELKNHNHGKFEDDVFLLNIRIKKGDREDGIKGIFSDIHRSLSGRAGR